nr:hypothetical protein [Elstera litoralis]
MDILAAVGFPLTAGVTGAAGEIRHDEGGVARLETAAVRRFFDNPRKLVPHNARILQIGLIAGENMKIGPANADALDPQQNFARAPYRLGSSFSA